ncbi:putative methyltransferase [Halolamina pelagica]|uniref:Putative methyltransferase n=1 Tax=Halolamina pelagica TaxID=699431 RepID=A0A0P7HDI7_9EURY|nr:putative methyltransferase [Halolamina pelagica]
MTANDSEETESTATTLADRRGQETKVYQPAEDSGLLADAAEEYARGRTLEVGTGSGWVAEQVAPHVPQVVAADVNPHACRQARERGIETVRTNLLDAFADGSFETVLFNPPTSRPIRRTSGTTGWSRRCRAARAAAN